VFKITSHEVSRKGRGNNKSNNNTNNEEYEEYKLFVAN
jgi:hypothetical protein